jgi:hypothetical protein
MSEIMSETKFAMKIPSNKPKTMLVRPRTDTCFKFASITIKAPAHHTSKDTGKRRLIDDPDLITDNPADNQEKNTDE